MALTPLIFPVKCNRIAYFTPLSFSLASRSYKLSLSRKLHRNAYSYCHSLPPFSDQSLAPRSLYSLNQRAISLIACDANNSASGEEDDNQALDAVHEMCTPINSQNSQELSEILADESPCVCKLLSFFQAFQGKKVYLHPISS